jgi:threonine dehydratase
VVAYSSGNHAQAVAKAASIMGARAAIVMPSDAPRLKLEATRGYGAEVILYDRHSEHREEIASRVVAERGAILVPPFEDRFIIAGQGTAGLEAAEDLTARGLEADVVLCPTSGGGLMAGTALAFGAMTPGARCYAVEPAEFDDYGRSLASGRRETNARSAGGLCDALLTPTPGELTFSINQPRLAGALTVSDEEVLRAMAFAFRWLKIVIEPGGCVALAAALSGKLELRGRIVVVIASGGNVDPDVFERALHIGL